MAQQRLGIIMNGVTGRMGTNQHLIRSIVAIRNEGGVALKNGDRVMPDPILVGRNAEKLEQLAKAHGHHALDHRPRGRAEEQGRHAVLRRRHHPASPQAGQAGHRRRQAHLLREAERRQLADALDLVRSRQQGRHQARRGAGQAVAARPAEAQDADRYRLLRPAPVGARRVRLLGVRGRHAARATARRGTTRRRGRRHHSRHAVPLALRARQSVRRGRERVVSRRDPHSQALGRERQAVQGRRRRCRLRDLPARRRRDRALQQLVVHARAARRSGHLRMSTARTARRSPGCRSAGARRA